MPSRDVGRSDLPWVVPRTRVMRLLAQRWRYRVVSVVAGAGLGKSTAMAMAMSDPLAEDSSTARTDYLVRVDASMSSASRFAALLAAALQTDETSDPVQVVAELAARDGDHSIILDDLHTLPPDSGTARALPTILKLLPANVGLVFLSRSEPPVPLARLRAAGRVFDIGEEDLAYDPEELAEISALTGTAASDLEATGGWPALVSLVVSRGHHGAWEYLAEEVLHTLDPVVRDALTVAAFADGADDRMLREVARYSDEPRAIVAEVPLVAVDQHGWLSPHSLWMPVLDSALTGDHRDRILHSLIDHSLQRNEPHTALRVALLLNDQQALAQAVRALCASEFVAYGTDELGRLLEAVPPRFLDFPEGRLLAAVLAAHRDPMSDSTRLSLQASAREFRRLAVPDCEVTALSSLALVLRWQGRGLRLLAIARRLFSLARKGHDIADRLASFARAGIADRRGDSAKALDEIADLRRGHLHDHWIAMVEFLRSTQLLNLGHIRESRDAAVRSRDLAMPAFHGGWSALAVADWHLNASRESVERMPIADEVENTFPLDLVWMGSWFGAAQAYAGMLPKARRNIAIAEQALHARSDTQLIGFVTWAKAALAVAEHDDDRARDHLRRYLRRQPIDTPFGQRLAARAPALIDLLLGDELPAGWAEPLDGPWQRAALDAAATLRALRSGQDVERLPEPPTVLCTLPLPWAVELVAQAEASGHPDARALATRIADTSDNDAREESERRLPAPLRDASAKLFEQIRTGSDNRAALLATLTAAERRVLDEVARGFTNQQIATRLGISVRTVANHLYSAYPKLEVSSRTEAAVLVRSPT